MTSVLRRLEQSRTVSSDRAAEALEDLQALRIRRHPSLPLLDRVWTLRRYLSAYDAIYIALAEGLEAPLITTDRRLARTPGHSAEVVAPTKAT